MRHPLTFNDCLEKTLEDVVLINFQQVVLHLLFEEGREWLHDDFEQLLPSHNFRLLACCVFLVSCKAVYLLLLEDPLTVGLKQPNQDLLVKLVTDQLINTFQQLLERINQKCVLTESIFFFEIVVSSRLFRTWMRKR